MKIKIKSLTHDTNRHVIRCSFCSKKSRYHIIQTFGNEWHICIAHLVDFNDSQHHLLRSEDGNIIKCDHCSLESRVVNVAIIKTIDIRRWCAGHYNKHLYGWKNSLKTTSYIYKITFNIYKGIMNKPMFIDYLR